VVCEMKDCVKETEKGQTRPGLTARLVGHVRRTTRLHQQAHAYGNAQSPNDPFNQSPTEELCHSCKLPDHVFRPSRRVPETDYRSHGHSGPDRTIRWKAYCSELPRPLLPGIPDKERRVVVVKRPRNPTCRWAFDLMVRIAGVVGESAKDRQTDTRNLLIFFEFRHCSATTPATPTECRQSSRR